MFTESRKIPPEEFLKEVTAHGFFFTGFSFQNFPLTTTKIHNYNLQG